jgi:hypothetical protein
MPKPKEPLTLEDVYAMEIALNRYHGIEDIENLANAIAEQINQIRKEGYVVIIRTRRSQINLTNINNPCVLRGEIYRWLDIKHKKAISENYDYDND